MTSSKLFIGNVPASMTPKDLEHMFEPYGAITECDIVKNYAFLHYTSPDMATQAAAALNGTKFDNNILRVEVSVKKPGGGGGGGGFGGGGPPGGMRSRGGGGGAGPSGDSKTTKLYVGNIPPSADSAELKRLFDTYGKVVECDIVRDFAFVHYEHEQEADLAADMLNGSEFAGAFISVERSHNRSKKNPTDKDGCFNCGQPGHISRDCRGGAGGRRRGGGAGGGGDRGYGPPKTGPPMYDPYQRDEIYEELAAYRALYGPLPDRTGYRSGAQAAALDRYRDYPSADPYARDPVPERSPVYRDPYERPPPYYYNEERRIRDPYGEDRVRAVRYAVRSRDEVARRRAPPPY